MYRKCFRRKIDGLNTSNPCVKKVLGNRLLERQEVDRVLYDLYYDNSFIDNIF